MCGINGIISTPGFRSDEVNARLQRMIDLLKHRGPDDTGHFIDRHAALGHSRLSVIDLSSSGHQPMFSRDRRYSLIFNGEIYNYRDLRKQFEGELQFQHDNDTEVLLLLYEKFGEGCLQYLRGMFAFAVWDAQERSLFFARDRLGKKPFFYRLDRDEFLFASELRAVIAASRTPLNININAVSTYLTLQYIPSPLTIFSEVFKLPPGHFGFLKDGKLNIQRYWSVNHIARKWTEEEALIELDKLLVESVRYRLISDVPLGAFLSGGIDSTVVVSLMRRINSGDVKTFTIRFEEEEFNEADIAREIATHFATEHLELSVTPDYADVLPKIIWHYSEPFADPSAIPTFYLAQLTRNHVTVALSGDGGDELFGGYPRYQIHDPKRANSSSLSPALNSLPGDMRYFSRLKRYLEENFLDLPDSYLRRISFFSEDEKRELFHTDFQRQLKGQNTLSWMRSKFSELEAVDFPENLMAVDLNTYLPDDLLVKVDIASMASSLETRTPFLDHHLVEFAATLPPELKIHNGSKYLLRKYLAGKVPEKIINRPKMGFGVPLNRWFRKELHSLLEETLTSRAALSRGYFNPEYIRRLIQRHTSGLFDHGYKLYALLILELWHREFVDRPDVWKWSALPVEI